MSYEHFRKSSYFLLILLFFTGLNTYSQISCTSEKIEEIFNRLELLDSFSADFVQTHESRVFSGPNISKGRIYIKPPDLFKIDTIEPEPDILILKGEIILRYDPRKDTIERKKIDRFLENFRLFYLFNTDYDEIKRNYFIRCILEDKIIRVNLTPRNHNIQRRLLNIIITIEKNDLIIENIEYFMRNDEKINISFENIMIDDTICDSIFDIENL